jgi:hypothetical protein
MDVSLGCGCEKVAGCWWSNEDILVYASDEIRGNCSTESFCSPCEYDLFSGLAEELFIAVVRLE